MAHPAQAVSHASHHPHAESPLRNKQGEWPIRALKTSMRRGVTAMRHVESHHATSAAPSGKEGNEGGNERSALEHV
jgi:hypothetical protein